MDRIARAIEKLEAEGALPPAERRTLEDECTHILSERLNDQAPLYEEFYRSTARRLIEVITAAERARIRRELLPAVLDDPSIRYEKGAAIIHENVLRRALSAVCPEEG